MTGCTPTLPSLLDELVRRGDTAIHAGDAARPLSELVRAARRFAAGLAKCGIGPGDRIALWLPNGFEWLIAFFAAARLGALAVAVNTRFRSAEVEYLLAKSKARLLIYDPGFLGIDFEGVLREVAASAVPDLETIVTLTPARDPGLGRRTATFGELGASGGDSPDLGTPHSRLIAFTTSGTTSKPKIVLHTQQAVVDHARDAAAGFELDRPDAKLLALLPLCGTFGFTSVMAALCAGAEVFLEPRYDAQAAAEKLRRHRISHSFGSDEMFAPVLDAAAGDDPFPDLHAIGFAAFRAGFRELVAAAQRRGVRMVGLYGSSEVHALFARQPFASPLDRRCQGGGVPVRPAAEIRIRDAATGEIAAAGTAGEIEIRSPTMLGEYLDDPQATARAFTADGFFRTGDLGTATADGGFVYLNRIGDALRISGYLVNPSEIEDILKEHPLVRDAQVVGVEVEQALRPFAFVLAQAGQAFDEAAVLAEAKARMAKYKLPYRVIALDEFPTTPSANGAKVQKTVLRDMAARIVAEPARN
ncbi:MAG: AMP-binding protein [Reyranellaceae bacterium]